MSFSSSATDHVWVTEHVVVLTERQNRDEVREALYNVRLARYAREVQAAREASAARESRTTNTTRDFSKAPKITRV